MHFSRAAGGIIAIITEGSPGRSEFLDPPLDGDDATAVARVRGLGPW
jgi:hypothetical protein